MPSAQTWTCPECNATNPVEARFCGDCGGPRPNDAVGDPHIGETVLGRYRIVGVLGEGGAGIVYRAEQRMGTTKRPVAIKVLHGAFTREASLRARFMRECEVVVQLEHPNTIRFFDFGELADGSLAIVMEYIDGESLADRLARGPISAERALHIVSQICGSLSEAHNRGIVHRDLKPENVLLANRAGENDVAKVCDFGIAKQEQSETSRPQLTLQGTVVGTPPYMSPEQIVAGAVDARSDIYSLGVMTYEMITGEYPFPNAESIFEWANAHLNAEPVPIDAHPQAQALAPSARAAIMRALSKKPEDRQGSALEYARQLTTTESTATHLGYAATVHRALAPTAPMPASMAGLSVAVDPPVPAPKKRRGGVIAILTLSLLLGSAASLGVFFTYFYHPQVERRPAHRPTVTQPITSDAGTSVASGPPRPSEWQRNVHHQRRVEGATAAIGPPDGREARIEARGVMTFELPAGTLVATDGGPAPDLYIEADASSGPYRVDVALDHHEFRTVVFDMVGPLDLDLDVYGVTRVRYVRIASRTSRSVLLDAVGVYRTEPAGS